MKILQLSAHFSPNVGGVETHLDDLVKGLIEKKHDVFVLTYKPLTVKTKAKIWESKIGLQIFRIPWVTGLFYKFVKNPAVEFIYLFPGLFIALPFIILFYKPDVIHTHGLIAGFVGVFWGEIFNVRTITTTHSLYHFPATGLYCKFARWIFSNSSKVLTLSKQSMKEISDLGVYDKKIQVFTYWIDLNKFKPVLKAKNKLKWDNKFVVLYVGRLVEEKGVLVLLESIKSWKKNICLAIIGTGPLEERIKEYKSGSNNLIYFGKINNDKLPLYYSAADITIVPSIHDEGFGRVILESLACGTPVIGSNRGAIPEAMNTSVGSLIDINKKNITKKVVTYYKNRSEMKKISKTAIQFANKMYSDDNIKTILRAYAEAA